MEGPGDSSGWGSWLSDLESSLSGEAAAWRERIADAVVDRALLKAGQTVADLGAGNGLLSLKAAKAVGRDGRVLAVDSAQECLDTIAVSARAAGVENVITLAGTIEDLPIDRSTCDAAVARSALVYTSDLARALRRVRGVLVPGGRY
jgi:arsenite methyltransferase